MSALPILPAADLDALLAQSATPVIIDFGSDHCPPCRRLEPLLAAIADRYAGQVTVRRIDTDAAPALIARYGLRSVPTLIAFGADGEVARLVGLQRPDVLTRLFDDALSAGRIEPVACTTA